MSKSETLRIDTNLIKKQNAKIRGYLIKLVLTQDASEQKLAVMRVEKYEDSRQYIFTPTSFDQYKTLLESAFPELKEEQHREIYIELAAEHPDGVICIVELPLEKIGYRPPIMERIFAVTVESLLSAACYRLNIMLSEQQEFIDKFINATQKSILNEKLNSKYDNILHGIKEFHQKILEEKNFKISTFSNYIISRLAAFEKPDIEIKHEDEHQFTKTVERLIEQLANDEQRVKLSGPDGEGDIFLRDVLMINTENGDGEFQYLGRHYGLTKSQLEDYEKLTSVKLEPHKKIVTASAHAPVDQPWLANFAAVEKGKFKLDSKNPFEEEKEEEVKITFINNRNGSTGIKLYARGDDHETAYRASQAISQQFQIRRAQLTQALLAAGDSPLKGFELRYSSNLFAYYLNDSIQNNFLNPDNKITDKENKLVKEAIVKTLSHIINEWVKNKLPDISKKFQTLLLDFIVKKYQNDHALPNNLQEIWTELEKTLLEQEQESKDETQLSPFRKGLDQLKKSLEDKEQPLLMFLQKNVFTKLLGHSEELVRVKHLHVHEITGKAIILKRSEKQWHQFNDMRKIHHAFEGYSYLAVPVNIGRWFDISGITAGTISVVMVELFQNLLKKYSIKLKKDKWKNKFSLYETALTILRQNTRNYIKFLEKYNHSKYLFSVNSDKLAQKKLLLSQLISIPENYRHNSERFFDKYLFKLDKLIKILTSRLQAEEKNFKLLAKEAENLRVIVRDAEIVLFPLANELHTRIFHLLSEMSFKQEDESFSAWTIYRLATQLFNKTTTLGTPLWKPAENNGFVQACLVLVAEILDICNSYGCKSANDRAALVSAILLVISKRMESGKPITIDEIPDLIKEANQIYLKQGDIGVFQTLLDKSATPKIDDSLLIHAKEEIKNQKFTFSHFYKPGKLAAHKREEHLLDHLNINEIHELSIDKASLEYKIYDNYRLSINHNKEIKTLLLNVAAQKGGKGIANTLEVKDYNFIEKKLEHSRTLDPMYCDDAMLQLHYDIQLYKFIKSGVVNSGLGLMSKQVQELLMLLKMIVHLPGVTDKDAEKIKILFETEEKFLFPTDLNEHHYFSQLKVLSQIQSICLDHSENSYLLSKSFSAGKGYISLSGIYKQISQIKFTQGEVPDLTKVITFLSEFYSRHSPRSSISSSETETNDNHTI